MHLEHLCQPAGIALGKLEHLMPVADKGAIGLAHHPHRNLVATFAADGMLQLWKA